MLLIITLPLFRKHISTYAQKNIYAGFKNVLLLNCALDVCFSSSGGQLYAHVPRYVLPEVPGAMETAHHHGRAAQTGATWQRK